MILNKNVLKQKEIVLSLFGTIYTDTVSQRTVAEEKGMI